MRPDPEGPADTRMMGIVHSALRRDLRRAALVLAGAEIPDARREAVADHLVWLVTFLRDHHRGEDDGLFPLVRSRDPALAPVLDAMDDEHAAIHPALAALSERAAAWRTDPAAGPQVDDAIASLQSALLPHLRHEEEELMPLVARTITRAEWRRWDQAANVRSKTTRDLAFSGHWLIDGATAADRGVVVHEVPAVPRFVLLHLMGGPYRRRRAAMWDGTAAAAVGLLPV